MPKCNFNKVEFKSLFLIKCFPSTPCRVLVKRYSSDHKINRQKNTKGEDEKITWGEDYLTMFFEINYLHGVPLFIGTRL